MDKEQTILNVGRRIRAIRDQRSLSLRALADQCGLSVNAISLIERGENSPTVASLHMLAQALQVPITAFFETETAKTIIYVQRTNRPPTQRNGIGIESLGSGLHNQQIEPFLITLEPGAGAQAEPVTHAGQEFVHCLTGEVEYTVGEQLFLLHRGDSLLFEASPPHHFRNMGTDPAIMLLVFQTTLGSHMASQSHLTD